jgi:endoglucanase
LMGSLEFTVNIDMGVINHKFWVQDFDRSGRGSPIYQQPLARWFTRTNCGGKSMRRYLKRAAPDDAIVVLYNIPDRDLGQWSKGGHENYEDYMNWIEEMVDAIRGYNPIIIFEPDALPHVKDKHCDLRIAIMKLALERLCTVCSKVYVDIGHCHWLTVSEAIELLHAVYNPDIRGFSLNVSNFQDTQFSIGYGHAICENSMKYKHFVVDTSRNGAGPALDGEWCNPPGRKIGEYPRLYPEIPALDATLWIKVPGESDGKKNGGPRAGRWFTDYAEELLRE